MKLGCIVMAAGSGSRFGGNKLLQPFCGVPMYQRALEAVPADLFDRVCVVTGYAAAAELASELGFSVVINDRPELGVSRTIRLGLEGMADCGGVLFMTADQPLLTGNTLRRLAEAFQKEPAIVAAAHGGKRGNPCVFPSDLFPELRALTGDVGGAKVIRAHPDRLRLLEVPAEELRDCDTAQTLRELEAENGQIR